MPHPLQLLLVLALIVVVAKVAGDLAHRLGQPAVFGEILAGLLLGPTALNILGWPVFAPHEGESLLAVLLDLADLGVILLMFVAGMETDLDEMRRVGKVAFWSAAGGVILPFIGGILIARAFGWPMMWEGAFLGTILTATSVSISAQTLMELGALRTKEGTTILGAAVIDDVMGILVLSVIVALARAGEGVDVGSIALVVVKMVAFFGVAIAAGRVFRPLTEWADRLGTSQGLLALVVATALVYAWAAEYFGGIATITGSYVAGVLFAQTPLRKKIDHGIAPLTYSVLVPVFFVSIGLRANGRELGDQALFTVLLVLVAIVAKVVGCAAGARALGFDNRQSVRVGIGMISRGEVGLIVAGYGLAHAIIGQAEFSASVIMVLATTVVTPPLLRLVFPKSKGPHVTIEESIAHRPPEIGKAKR
jgi:Kef-type K+ transport system membrane component KefB